MPVNWLFDIGSTYYLSLEKTVFDSRSYSGAIQDDSFKGLDLCRIKTEMNIHGPSKLDFKIIDNLSAFSVAAIKNQPVIVRLVIDGIEAKSWRFKALNAEKSYNTISVHCTDFLSTLMDGPFPVTRLVKDTFPETVLSSTDNTACVPKVFGPDAYIPLQSVADNGHVYFILGEEGPDYTISEMTSPHEQDGQDIYTTGVTYVQSTINGCRVFEPEIDGDPKYWVSGTRRLSPLVKYTASDTATMTNPVDILKYIIKEFGAADTDFGTTWAGVASAVATRGVSFSRGYIVHEDRSKVIANLCALCDVTLHFEEKIEIRLNSKSSQMTITPDHIWKRSADAPGTFSHNRLTPSENDSGYIEFFVAGYPQDKTVKAAVPAVSTKANPAPSTLSCIGISNNVTAQKIGTLFFFRKLMKEGKVTFLGDPALRSLLPGQIITINDNMYGGTHIVMVDKMSINRDTTINFEGVVFPGPLKDFEEISTTSILIDTDPPTDGESVLSKAKDYTESWSGEGADSTQWALDMGASIANAMVGGQTLMVGSYINAAILQITGQMIIGEVPSAGYATSAGAANTATQAGDTNFVNGVPSGDVQSQAYNGNYVYSNAGVLAYADYIDGSILSTGYPAGTYTLCINQNYMGFIKGSVGVFETFIAADGEFRFAGDANNYIWWDGATLQAQMDELILGTGQGITVQDGGGITLEDGGDLILETTGPYMSNLQYRDTGYSRGWDINLYPTGTNLWIKPSSGNTSSSLTMGNGETSEIYARATGYIEAKVQNSAGSSYIAYTYGTTALYPVNINYSDPSLGTDIYRWGSFYGSSVDVTGTVCAGGAEYDGRMTLNIKAFGAGENSWPIYCENVAGTGIFSVNGTGAVSAYKLFPLYSGSSGTIGDTVHYFTSGYFWNLNYKGGLYTFDKLDDLQVLEDIGPVKNSKGDYIQVGKHALQGPPISQRHPSITNFEKLPEIFLEEYDIEVTEEELTSIVNGDVSVIRGIDAELIEEHTFRDPTKEIELAFGALRQLNKEVTEEVLEPVNALIEDLITRVNNLEKNKEAA